MTLTIDQKNYRKKQRESKRDFKTATSINGNPAHHATKRKLCIRISEVAHNYLKKRGFDEQRTVTDVLEKLLICALPNYNDNGSAKGFTSKRYTWKKLQGNTLKRKGGGAKQINIWIMSTAWHKLDIAADHTGRSKARVVEMMIREKL